ncbi:MAG: hypothetical protein ACTTKL_05745 [Treponema sp.]
MSSRGICQCTDAADGKEWSLTDAMALPSAASLQRKLAEKWGLGSAAGRFMNWECVIVRTAQTLFNTDYGFCSPPRFAIGKPVAENVGRWRKEFER